MKSVDVSNPSAGQFTGNSCHRQLHHVDCRRVSNPSAGQFTGNLVFVETTLGRRYMSQTPQRGNSPVTMPSGLKQSLLSVSQTPQRGNSPVTSLIKRMSSTMMIFVSNPSAGQFTGNKKIVIIDDLGNDQHSQTPQRGNSPVTDYNTVRHYRTHRQ